MSGADYTLVMSGNSFSAIIITGGSVSGAGLLVEFSYVTHGGQSDNF